MQELDLSKMFDSMSTKVDNSDNPIQAIYDIIPSLDSMQQQQLFVLQFYIDRWELDHVQSMLDHFLKVMKENKNLSFFGSKNLQNMLSAYTQTDLIRGINIRSKQQDDNVPVQ